MSLSVPHITVLVPTFNRAVFIEECLDSLINQTVKPHQIIVVNDGSTDQTRNILQPYLSNIDYMETQQVGKSAAINQNFEFVKGDYLWIFDDDDVALPDALERFVTPLEQSARFDYSFGTFYFTESNRDYSIGAVERKFRMPDLSKYGRLIPLLISNYLSGASIFARRSVYEAVGAFNEKLFRSQDYEMAIRIVRNFEGFYVKEKPVFYYRQHHENRGNNNDRFKIEERTKKWQHYNRLFFKELYTDMHLSEYLPATLPFKGNERQAYIQRMVIMGIKNVKEVVLKDLQELALMDNASKLNRQEIIALQKLVKLRKGSFKKTIYNDKDFFREIKALSKSRLIRIIRTALFVMIWKRCKIRNFRKALFYLKEALFRTFWMYI